MDDERRESLGATVRTLREAKGLTRRQLADSAGISVEMLAKVEQGRKAPSAKTLSGLAAGLGMDTSDLAQRSHTWEAMAQAGASNAVLRTSALGGIAAGGALAAMAIPGVGAIAGGVLAASTARSELRNRRRLERVLASSLSELSDDQLQAIALQVGIEDSDEALGD